MRGCVGVAIIFQDSATTDLLAETGKIGCRQDSTPMDPNLKLCKAEEESTADKKMYQRLVGKLIYLAHKQPDIAHSVSVISQFMHQLKESHLQAAYRILHYLKGSPGKETLFKRNGSLTLQAYTDARLCRFSC